MYKEETVIHTEGKNISQESLVANWILQEETGHRRWKQINRYY